MHRRERGNPPETETIYIIGPFFFILHLPPPPHFGFCFQGGIYGPPYPTYRSRELRGYASIFTAKCLLSFFQGSHSSFSLLTFSSFSSPFHFYSLFTQKTDRQNRHKFIASSLATRGREMLKGKNGPFQLSGNPFSKLRVHNFFPQRLYQGATLPKKKSSTNFFPEQ